MRVYTIHCESTKELRLGSPIVCYYKNGWAAKNLGEKKKQHVKRIEEEINIISPDFLITLLIFFFSFILCALTRCVIWLLKRLIFFGIWSIWPLNIQRKCRKFIVNQSHFPFFRDRKKRNKSYSWPLVFDKCLFLEKKHCTIAVQKKTVSMKSVIYSNVEQFFVLYKKIFVRIEWKHLLFKWKTRKKTDKNIRIEKQQKKICAL